MTSLEEIYQQYFKEIYLFLYRLNRDPHLAEDLTAETFLKALRSLDSFKDGSSIKTWLFQIAKNTYFSDVRKKKLFLDIERIPEVAAQINLERTLIQNEQAATIYQVFQALPEPYREVFYLRMFAELDFKTIGELFGKSANWACVTFHRARKKIKEEMERTS